MKTLLIILTVIFLSCNSERDDDQLERLIARQKAEKMDSLNKVEPKEIK